MWRADSEWNILHSTFKRPPVVVIVQCRRSFGSVNNTAVMFCIHWLYTVTQLRSGEREDWSSNSVVNHTIVTDPTIRQPGSDLSRHTWSMMNHFQTGQGPRCANLQKWGLAQSHSCDRGQWQTMNHTVNTCQLTEYEGGLNLLHKADDDAVIWLESTVTAALNETRSPWQTSHKTPPPWHHMHACTHTLGATHRRQMDNVET